MFDFLNKSADKWNDSFGSIGERNPNLSNSLLISNRNRKSNRANDSPSATVSFDSYLLQPQLFNINILQTVHVENEYFEEFSKLNKSKIDFAVEFGSDVNDLSLFRGKSFRIGWSKNFEMLTLNERRKSKKSDSHQSFMAQKRPIYIGDMINCRTICRKKLTMPIMSFKSLESHILTQLKYVQITNGKYNLPKLAIKNDKMSANHLLNEQLFNFQQHPRLKLYENVWRLIFSLWSDVSIKENQLYLMESKRKELLSEWLTETIIVSEVNKVESFLLESEPETVLKTILSHLLTNQISEAAKLAFDSNLMHLSLLISQINSSEEFLNLMRSQLQKWIQFGIYKHVPETLLKIYMLLAGEMTILLPNHEFVNVCDRCDWKTIYGCSLWYFCNWNAPIASSTEIFENKMQILNRKPSPHYCQATECDSFDHPVKDICFYILKLFADHSYPLKLVLNPLNYGPKAFDFEFVWYLLIIFKSFNCNAISNEFETFLIRNFALQLESNGFWHFAVYVLLFLDDSIFKRNLFYEILKRNLSVSYLKSSQSAEELFLIHRLNVPIEIIQKIKMEKLDDFSKNNSSSCEIK